MFDHNHYVPVLKWRMGEYQALMRLNDPVKDWVTPLFEIPTEGWNFETETPMRSLDDHLTNFGAKLYSKWGGRRCFVDSPYLDGTARLASGIHHVEEIFRQAQAAGCHAIPVVGLQRSPDYVAAVRSVVLNLGSEVCIRLEGEDFTANLQASLQGVLATLQVQPERCHLVIDLEAAIAPSALIQAQAWQAFLSAVAFGAWRSLTVVGTAFPQTLAAAQYRPHGSALRHEWLAYRQLIANLPAGHRVPTFGDYATSAPNTAELDPRMLDPNAKIKYTLDDEWIVFVGSQVKRYGRGQYQQMSQSIVNAAPPFFMGAAYSWGDAFIEGCASGREGTGGTSTWPSVATNHHVTKAVRDVANLHGTLTPP
ncbi:beta family protein [Xenophilus aerolatus]